MISLICIIFLFLTILFIVLDVKYAKDLEDLYMTCAILFSTSFIAVIILSVYVTKGATLDERIELYSEQNEKIETEITELVEKYMNYESKTFKELSPESAITLVSLYPDLKSDALVQSQCDLYIENNKKILELKEAKVNLSVKKWWLYFGR